MALGGLGAEVACQTGAGGLFGCILRSFLLGIKNTSVFTIFSSGDIKTFVFYVVFCMWASKHWRGAFQPWFLTLFPV